MSYSVKAEISVVDTIGIISAMTSSRTSRASRRRARAAMLSLGLVAALVVLTACESKDEKAAQPSAPAAPAPAEATPVPADAPSTPAETVPPAAAPSPPVTTDASGDERTDSSEGEPGAESGPTEEVDRTRRALEDALGPALAADLGLTESEASCVAEEILARWSEFESALSDPDAMAEQLVARTEAAQEVCLTPERLAELEADIASDAAGNAEVDAYLLVMAGFGDDLTGDDDDLVAAGRLICNVVEGAGGSLSSYVATLNVTSRAVADLQVQIGSLLGATMEVDRLIAFSAIAVDSFCPELNDL